MKTREKATIEDLYKIDGKAEIVNGRIVRMPPTGDDPGYAGDRVFISLDNYAEQTGAGRAVSHHASLLLVRPPDPSGLGVGSSCDGAEGALDSERTTLN